MHTGPQLAPRVTAYNASSKITKPLVNQILAQSQELPDEETVKTVKSKTISEDKAAEAEKYKNIKTKQTPDLQRFLGQHSEPGASSWLGALPLEKHNFNLTKSEFNDSLCLRYKQGGEQGTFFTCKLSSLFQSTHGVTRMPEKQKWVQKSKNSHPYPS